MLQREFLQLVAVTIRSVLATPGVDAGPQVSSRRAPQPSRHCRIADAGTGKSTLIRRLDEVDRWETILSGGELQRIGFARLLVMQPDIAILDEATAPNWPSFTIAS